MGVLCVRKVGEAYDCVRVGWVDSSPCEHRLIKNGVVREGGVRVGVGGCRGRQRGRL